jgi:putative ABC transport system permease protein
MVLRRLALSNFATHRVRVALTVAAVALSVSLVVAVTSGYASVEAAAYRYLSLYLGSTDAQVTRTNDPRGGIRQSLVDALAADPDVRHVTARLELETGLVDTDGLPVAGRPAQIIGIDRPHDVLVEKQEMAAGSWFDSAAGNVAVVDQVAAEKLKVKVGDTFELPGVTAKLPLKVVGIVHKPGILAAHIQSIYVPLHTLQAFALPEDPQQVSRLMIDLQGGSSSESFERRWGEKLKGTDPLLRLKMAAESRQQLDANLQGMEALSYLGGTVSMVAATFIVFSALSMGVAERQRTLAMLRAIGMQRGQVGALVVLEGVILAIFGIAIGVPLGWFWVKLLTWMPNFSGILTAGVVLSRGGVLLGAGGSLLAALAASALPAWSAARVRPLEAMNPLADPPRPRLPIVCAIAGLVLIAIDPFLMFAPLGKVFGLSEQVTRAMIFYGHFVIGLPALMLGFFLLAPLFVWTIERLAGPIVSAMFGLRHALLRQQLSGGIWRAAGTASALMVGLAVLIVMQTQGNSMLATWRLPQRFPDIFIVAPPLGPLGPAKQAKLETIKGIRPGELMPIAIASPQFSNPIFAVVGAALIPDATMFFGVDPDKAFDMMELEFLEGTPEQAREMLKKGRHIIVTMEFRELKGLGVGDTLALKTPKHGTVDYTIAGVVWSPGMDVITSVYDLGKQFDQRTAGSLFGTLEDARNDFGVSDVFLFAANLDYHVDKEKLVADIQNELGMIGMKVGDVRKIKHEITQGLGNLLMLVSSVAFAAMAVSSLGVTNTIMASIRSRRWQLGILRSVGVTRGQLVRLVFAEALVLGLIGCGLGCAAGLLMSVDARRFSGHLIGFMPPTDVPWGIVAGGIGIVLFIALAASAAPAISTARQEPLALLQAGRASA